MQNSNALSAFDNATSSTTDNTVAPQTNSESVTTVAPTACTFTKTLKMGMTDPEVKCLQQTLNTKGFSIVGAETGKETSFFGKGTLAALKAFQTANNLTVDGILGMLSQAALK